MLERLRGRQEWALVRALWRADRPLATVWWAVLALRGVLPAAFAIAMGVLVGAVNDGASLAGPLAGMGIVFVLLQVLTPLHLAIGYNLGDRTAAWLYDVLTDACIAPPGIGHLEDPELGSDLTVAREFDLGMTGPPLSISMDFIAGSLVEMVAGLASAAVLAGYAWWAPIVLSGAWLSTHWLLKESAVWRDRNTDEVRGAQRDADYAYRLAVDPPAAKELRLFGLAGWTIDRFLDRRTTLHRLQYDATKLRERSVLVERGGRGRRQPGRVLVARRGGRRRPDRSRPHGDVRAGRGGGLAHRLRRPELGARRRDGAGCRHCSVEAGDGPRRRAGPWIVAGLRPAGEGDLLPRRHLRLSRVRLLAGARTLRPHHPRRHLARHRRPERCGQDDAGQAALPPLRPAVGRDRDRRDRPASARPRCLARAHHGRVPGLHPVRAPAAGQRGPGRCSR